MERKKIEDYYDAVAEIYHEQYNREKLMEMKIYPANYFRLQMLLNAFISKNVKRVLEVGVGEGTPLVTMAKTGVEVWGFDISEEMVKAAKKNMERCELNPDHIFLADIQDPVTYAHCLKDGLFDGLMAMGVMPHVENDEVVMKNMANCVREGGSLFVEFRNKLMSLFSFNRYTMEFILDDLLKDVSQKLKDLIYKEIGPTLRMDLPKQRKSVDGKDAPGYDAILSKFHNPFEVKEMFEKLGFKDIKFLWYHYHPAMPFLEGFDKELFRKEAFKLEHETSGWRGMFLCSAFIVEAVK
jgi:2-polyprenyl-3-methyl-5-hydroxy-6-metoxy-1,4-benzoquinol methylase